MSTSEQTITSNSQESHTHFIISIDHAKELATYILELPGKFSIPLNSFLNQNLTPFKIETDSTDSIDSENNTDN